MIDYLAPSEFSEAYYAGNVLAGAKLESADPLVVKTGNHLGLWVVKAEFSA
jgi:hypothetical protein